MGILLLVAIPTLLACGPSDRGLSQHPFTQEETTLFLAEVQRAIGVGYAYGGRSFESGLDCSALIVLAYKTAGYDLFRLQNRVSSDANSNDLYQFNAQPVSGLHDLSTGDLIFFDQDSNGMMDHVAVFISYTNDEVHVIDATDVTGVVSFRVIDDYWSKNPFPAVPLKIVPATQGNDDSRR